MDGPLEENSVRGGSPVLCYLVQQNSYVPKFYILTPLGKQRSSSKSQTPAESLLRLTNGANGEMTSTTATKNGSNGRANSIHMMTEGMKQDSNLDRQTNPIRV